MGIIRIYDPAMCCDTGVCGPSVDPELTRVATAIFMLEKENIDIRRFNLGSEPQAFIEEKAIKELLHVKGADDALPAVMVDGTIVKTGKYPTNQEFAKWSGLSEDKISSKPSSGNNITLL
ncbi:arsenite efflux transporter metallochaperone ArsD [Thalassobacillus sp. C254]|uniref:arsenite efflux transporter metallochaperone ArsD n=1 Tax=Thalassobacillus sp. C254 TaxID=1225341 RepID=UPI0006CFCC36|nr:arsenite efflux transporter metallochaperone ArsD [Thalassobacillus sp. C254]